MEKRNSQLEHGQPMEQTRGLFCTCDSGVATPEASSIMRALSGARCTGVRLYTL